MSSYLNPERRIYIPVNGIRTLPEDKQAWTDRFADWIFRNTRDFASPDEYFSFAATKSLFQDARVRDLVLMVQAHPFNRIVLVGHSNGCDIICQALPFIKHHIESVHLFAGAVEHDFNKNNLNHALKFRMVDRVHLYVSAGDAVLKLLARPTRSILNFFGIKKLGYGFLGYQAAVDRPSLNMCPKALAEKRITILDATSSGFGHSTWFDEEFFQGTMDTVTSAEEDLS